jgi:hypothetical protein
MAVPVLQHHVAQFSRRNTYVDAALGVVAASRRLEDLADRCMKDSAPPQQASVSTERGPESVSAEQEAVVLFALGLISFGRTFRGILANWEAATARPGESHTAPMPKPEQGLLR